MSSQFHALRHTLSESSPQPNQNMQRKFNHRNIFVNEQLINFFSLMIRLNDPLYVEVCTTLRKFTSADPKHAKQNSIRETYLSTNSLKKHNFFFLTIRLNDPLYVEVSTTLRKFTSAGPKHAKEIQPEKHICQRTA